jgi:sugar phosphate isomerase/epimerase
MAVKLSGFADEAGDSIEEQVEVTRALGWHAIEIRTLSGKNFAALDRDELLRVRSILDENGIAVSAVGSTIANWGHSIDEAESVALEETRRAIDAMDVLGTRMVRIMSWQVLRDESGRALDDQREAERVRRLSEICNLFVSAGVTPLHENCATWGGMSGDHTRRMVGAVPGIKLVFDTGNPPVTDDFRRPWPYPPQSTREYWDAVRDHVEHVHIKDSRRDPETGSEEFCWPGEGEGELSYILTRLAEGGYDGYLSIEPHMAVVFHDRSVTASRDARRNNYIEYGRRLERLLEELGIAYER